MRDLVRLAGLPRETIHFYLAQGLLPKPLKTGRNTALYGPQHLDRLHRIKELQERHFLPLRAIKAVLEEGTSGEFSEAQEAMLKRVRASLPASASKTGDVRIPIVDIVPAVVSRRDLDAMKKLGLVEVEGSGAGASVSADDAVILRCWAEVRDLLGKEDADLTPDIFAVYDDAVSSLVARETRVLTQQFSGLSGPRAAELIEASFPLVARLLEALRHKKVEALLQGAAPAPR
ncbi:MAG: MerR family transcriptional regulator [Candidatus Binatia bacterium]